MALNPKINLKIEASAHLVPVSHNEEAVQHLVDRVYGALGNVANSIDVVVTVDPPPIPEPLIVRRSSP